MPLMTPLIFNLGPTELIIILVIILLLFGGTRLAGLGKSSGRALKEFKEETRGLRDESKSTDPANSQANSQAHTQANTAYPPQVTNGQPGQVPPTYQQPYQQAPQQSPYTPTPNNLTDPPATDARRDV